MHTVPMSSVCTCEYDSFVVLINGVPVSIMLIYAYKHEHNRHHAMEVVFTIFPLLYTSVTTVVCTYG